MSKGTVLQCFRVAASTWLTLACMSPVGTHRVVLKGQSFVLVLDPVFENDLLNSVVSGHPKAVSQEN